MKKLARLVVHTLRGVATSLMGQNNSAFLRAREGEELALLKNPIVIRSVTE